MTSSPAGLASRVSCRASTVASLTMSRRSSGTSGSSSFQLWASWCFFVRDLKSSRQAERRSSYSFLGAVVVGFRLFVLLPPEVLYFAKRLRDDRDHRRLQQARQSNDAAPQVRDRCPGAIPHLRSYSGAPIDGAGEAQHCNHGGEIDRYLHPLRDVGNPGSKGLG